MRIGLDFDNTLVCYDALFHQLAIEQGLIPADLAVNKTAIRDYLRAQNREPEWTQLQGIAYGPRMTEARPFEGLEDCLRMWQNQGWQLMIVSHKTLTPFVGEPYDLHAAARNWIDVHLHQAGLMPTAEVYFEVTREAKLKRAAELDLDCFIDDLPDILLDLDPRISRRLLFDPHDQYGDPPADTKQTGSAFHRAAFERWPSWTALQALV